MAWIESHQSVGGHPKTRRAARLLGVSIPTMVGHLHLLWHWALEYAQEGDLSRYDSLDIADAAYWDGNPDDFVDALINAGPGDEPGFLQRNGDFGPPDDSQTGELVIRDWWDYAGKLIAKRQADSERKRRARNRTSSKDDKDVQQMSNGCPEDGAGNRTVPNRTVPNLTSKVAPDKPTQKKSGKERDLLFEQICIECYGKEYTEITDSEKGRVNKAAKELRKLNATPEDVVTRAKRYREELPDYSFTPQTLTKMWTDLGKDHKPKNGKSQNGSGGYYAEYERSSYIPNPDDPEGPDIKKPGIPKYVPKGKTLERLLREAKQDDEDGELARYELDKHGIEYDYPPAERKVTYDDL